jgi:hypothetical protein
MPLLIVDVDGSAWDVWTFLFLWSEALRTSAAARSWTAWNLEANAEKAIHSGLKAESEAGPKSDSEAEPEGKRWRKNPN